MKLHTLCAALALLLAFAATGRADPFSDIENCPNTYWVPPPVGYAPAPGPYYSGYYGPPPVYYPPPPPLPVPGFFIHFHIH